MFLALDKYEQEAVTTFFNLHNASIWIYTNLSKEGVLYCNEAIAVSMDINKVKQEVTEEEAADIAAAEDLKKTMLRQCLMCTCARMRLDLYVRTDTKT